MIKVLADKHLVNISDFLPPEIDLHLYNPDSFSNDIPDDTDALLIRTVTKINPQSYPTFPKKLKFIGTGSAGTDHVDISHLKKNGIAFADAAGCNARSVAEYIAVALLLWAEQRNVDLTQLAVGIVGVGHTGSEVQKILEGMRIETVGYDPPREQRDSGFKSATLDDVLQTSVLTFHTPLTQSGSYPTFHWFNMQKSHNNTFKLVINAARGGIIDEKALLKAHQKNRIGDYILDVWENEPGFNDTIAQNAFIKTPHIAGYSIQAKNNASKLVANALLSHFSLDAPANIPDYKSIKVDVSSCCSSISNVLTCLHPIDDYQQKLISLIDSPPTQKQAGFNHIRTSYPLRYELQSMNINEDIAHIFPILSPLF